MLFVLHRNNGNVVSRQNCNFSCIDIAGCQLYTFDKNICISMCAITDCTRIQHEGVKNIKNTLAHTNCGEGRDTIRKTKRKTLPTRNAGAGGGRRAAPMSWFHHRGGRVLRVSTIWMGVTKKKPP